MKTAISELSDVPIILSEVTYLEMNTNPHIGAADLAEFTLQRVENPTVREYMEIYTAVGRDYLWNYRPGQSDAEIATIITAPTTWLYFLRSGSEVVGMAELDATKRC